MMRVDTTSSSSVAAGTRTLTTTVRSVVADGGGAAAGTSLDETALSHRKTPTRTAHDPLHHFTLSQRIVPETTVAARRMSQNNTLSVSGVDDWVRRSDQDQDNNQYIDDNENDTQDDSSDELSIYLEAKLAAILLDDNEDRNDDHEEKKDTEGDFIQHTLDELLADDNPPESMSMLAVPMSSSPVRSASIQFPEQRIDRGTGAETATAGSTTGLGKQMEPQDGAPDRPIIVDAAPMTNAASTSTTPNAASAVSASSIRKPGRLGTRRHTDPGVVPNSPFDRLSQSDHSPRRRTSLDRVYNPLTGYSPGKYRRKRIWGSSNAHLPHLPQLPQLPRRQTSPDMNENMHNQEARYHDRDLNSSDSASTCSINSEELLERKASQIRAELRYAELVQLAEDAERAAEEGQESYSGRPWIAGTDFDSNSRIHNKNDYTTGMDLSAGGVAPSAIKRHFSYSEGLPLPSSPLREGTSRQPTLPAGVQNLRDAEDVFPSFDSFHKNLRTHYLRHQVSQTILIFREKNSEDRETSHRKTTSSVQELERRLTKGAQDFMNSFSFDILRQSASSQSQQHDHQPQHADSAEVVDLDDEIVAVAINGYGEAGEDDASSVGDVLAEHIHSSDHPSTHKSIHPISLPGLPLPETTLSILPSPTLSQSHDGPLVDPGSRNTNFGRSPSLDEERITQPRILFPAGVGSLTTKRTDSFRTAPETPVQSGGELGDFVTPARLREIRRPDDERVRSFVNGESMILPANSVIQESPGQQSIRTLQAPSSGYHHHVRRTRAPPVTDLLLPAFSTEATENQNVVDQMVRLAPSRSYDDGDDCDGGDDATGTKDYFQLEPDGVLDPIREQLSVSESRAGSKTSSLVSPGASPRTGSLSSSPVVPKTATISSPLALSLSEEDRPLCTGDTPWHGHAEGNQLNASADSTRRRIVRPSVIRSQEMIVRNASKVPLLTEIPRGSFDEVDCRCLMSPSLEQLQDMMEDDESDDDANDNVSIDTVDDNAILDAYSGRHMGEGGSGSLRQSAMNMLHKLSPSRRKNIAKARQLFVHPQVNDDFLQNYMYCSRDARSDVNVPITSDTQEGFCMTGESCQDDGYCGLGLAFLGMNYCGFNSQDVDCMTAGGGINPIGGGSSARPSSEILPLTLTPYKKRHEQQHGGQPRPTSDGGGWFDAATERVDDMIDSYIFGTQTPVGHFQPPSLRKIMRHGTASMSKDGTDGIHVNHHANHHVVAVDNTTGDGTPGPPSGMVQALFPPSENDLSDTQYALVFGTSRSDDDPRALEPPSLAGSEEMEPAESPTASGKAETTTTAIMSSPSLRREVLPSYSSSSDDPAQERLQRQLKQPRTLNKDHGHDGDEVVKRSNCTIPD